MPRSLLVLIMSIVFFKSSNLCALTDTTLKQQTLNRIFELVGLTNFTKSVKKIKKYKKISAINEFDYELKTYFKHIYLWRKFDEVQFTNGLRQKILGNFSLVDLSEIESVFLKPFPAKVIKAIVLQRDLFNFSQDFMNTNYHGRKLSESRYSVVNNLYLIHGMDIQREKVAEVLASFSGTKVSTITFMNKVKVEKYFSNPILLDKRAKAVKEFIIRYLAKDLVSFRHFELREYLRLMKKKSTQKFLQLYANYHFLYMIKFMENYQVPAKLLEPKS